MFGSRFALASLTGLMAMAEEAGSTAGAPAPATKPAKTKKAKKTPAKAAKKSPAKKAKKAAATSDRLVPADLSRYHKDPKVKTAGGNPSLDNNDPVAKTLRGKSLDDVYKIVAKKANVPEKELRAKYKHLNNGMQRMNLGNVLRGAL